MASDKVTRENDEIEIDLRAFFLRLKTKWLTCILGLLLGAVLALGYSIFLVNPEYQSTAMVYLRGNGASSISIQDLQVGTQLTKDYEIIFKSRPVLESTIDELNLDMSTKELSDAISITNAEDTRILNITVTAQTPELAKDIANSIMDNGVQKVSEIDAQQPYVVETAIENAARVGMSRSRMTILGAVAGLVITLGYIFLRFVLSDNITSADDLENTLNVPVLAVVLDDPQMDFKKMAKNNKKGA
ncbi:capsular polysaccharide biosynthesis protein [Firmicutes bacterium CAG:308]|nr:capsular polysaccharide biosynthesis protein [Firmicutes bacterium CAG:308]